MQALLAPLGVAVVQDARGYVEVQGETLAAVTNAGAQALLASGLAPPFILEDSGLFVEALNGFPGVYSRHALETIGVAGLLRLMSGLAGQSRRASFRADLLLVDGTGGRHHFEGSCLGTIAVAPAGEGGFGFDPIFIPDQPSEAGAPGQTFAQLPPTVKGRLSHRGGAARALAVHLAAPKIQTAKP